MGENFIPKTDKEKITYLMSTDDRREKHIKELQKDVENLSKNILNLTTAIVGSEFNKKDGLLNLVDDVKSSVKEIKQEVKLFSEFKNKIEPQFNIAKYVFLCFISAIIIVYVNEKGKQSKHTNQIENLNK